MTPEQQHNIRNGVLGAFQEARELDRIGGLSQEQQILVAKVMRNILRIGQSVGMGTEYHTYESFIRKVCKVLFRKY